MAPDLQVGDVPGRGPRTQDDMIHILQFAIDTTPDLGLQKGDGVGQDRLICVAFPGHQKGVDIPDPYLDLQ